MVNGNQISDSAGNLTIDELQRKFEGTLTSSDNLSEETGQEKLGKSVSDEPSRNLNEVDKTFCPFYVFCVRVHGLDYHPFSPCVYDYVWHVNIALMKNKNDSPKKYWANFHIGAYRNTAGKICIVLFENVAGSKNPRICKKICAPSRSDFQRALERSMTEVFASAKIAVSATVIATAAVTLSYLVYPILMAL